MTAINITASLAALLGHLNRHPHLNEITLSSRTDGDGIDVHAYARNRGRVLVALGAWARTLPSADHVLVTRVDDDSTMYLVVAGDLDGIPIKVTALVDHHVHNEADLLAANTPVEKGATFPIDLLLRLASSVDAEAVAL